MQLKDFGDKYPFLKGNLPFWEKYIKARDELFGLCSRIDALQKLKNSAFPQNIAQGKPLFAYEQIRIDAADLDALAQAFCRAMGLAPRAVSWGETVSLAADLAITPDEAGFVLAEVHAALAAYCETLVAGDDETLNWLENYCPICGAAGGMGLIAASGKKNLVCSHCHTVWVYLRTACGLCGHVAERGATVLSADELPDWFIETCAECGHYLKVCDMRETISDIVVYPLHYLTTWELDLAARESGRQPAMFAVFERAGWLRPDNAN